MHFDSPEQPGHPGVLAADAGAGPPGPATPPLGFSEEDLPEGGHATRLARGALLQQGAQILRMAGGFVVAQCSPIA